MPTLAKIVRSAALALVLLGSVAGGATLVHHTTPVVADSGGQSNDFDPG